MTKDQFRKYFNFNFVKFILLKDKEHEIINKNLS